MALSIFAVTVLWVIACAFAALIGFCACFCRQSFLSVLLFHQAELTRAFSFGQGVQNSTIPQKRGMMISSSYPSQSFLCHSGRDAFTVHVFIWFCSGMSLCIASMRGGSGTGGSGREREINGNTGRSSEALKSAAGRCGGQSACITFQQGRQG